MSYRKEFKKFTVIITGRVMTVYDKTGSVIRRNVYPTAEHAVAVFSFLEAF